MKGENIMKYKWKYFIVLNWDDTLNNLVEEKVNDELFVCCDVAVAKSFDSTEELLKWVKENTDLKIDNGDFKIEGQYLPVEIPLNTNDEDKKIKDEDEYSR